MIDFSEVTINNKELFDGYLKKHHPEASELTFSNIFMWRNYYKFQWTVIEGFLCMISIPENSEPFSFMPMGNCTEDALPEAIERLREYFLKNNWKLKFKRVTLKEKDLLAKFAKSDEDIIFDRDSSDYVYLSEDLVKLAGKKFDGKRNHINKFRKLYEYEYIPITPENINECYRIMDEWCAERSCKDHRNLYCEKLANTELLANYERIGCKGAMVKVNGRYEAFTVGEMLNSNTAVIHIEKANSKINGLYTFINQQFCENEWSNVSYINREQDLGIEGLRKAKLSYNPVKLIEKFTINIS